eukprot:TRINITY_DN1474_c0_g1_i1.p1 TRINITY_DN1474_c0_g1~~TRINITY_DN1474_c0_g1_i1.p1  ORF type:complete len:439 (+),score=131.91 TRINITY_DN1474_c0_g1_i1:34-1317(+)
MGKGEPPIIDHTILSDFDLTTDYEKLGSWDFYNQTLKAPKTFLAPMVAKSDLIYRILVRKYGCDVCVTPMLNSSNFDRGKENLPTEKKLNLVSFIQYWFPELEDDSCDRPLITQIAGYDPDKMLRAAQVFEDRCDAIDVNFGCPQRIASRGGYGAHLASNWPLCGRIVNKLHKHLKVPVTCKIRIFPDLNDTVNFAKMLESAGCQLLFVHGRDKSIKSHHDRSTVKYEYIKAVVEALNIPVVANGGIHLKEHIKDVMEYTNSAGVMIGTGMNHNPAISIYTEEETDRFEMVYYMLDICTKYPFAIKSIRAHILDILGRYLYPSADRVAGINETEKEIELVFDENGNFIGEVLDYHHDLRDIIARGRELEDFKTSVEQLEKRIRENIPPPPYLSKKPKRQALYQEKLIKLGKETLFDDKDHDLKRDNA